MPAKIRFDVTLFDVINCISNIKNWRLNEKNVGDKIFRQELLTDNETWKKKIIYFRNQKSIMK